MLVTEQNNRSNQHHALVLAAVVAVLILLLALKWHLAVLALPLAWCVYHLMRRRTLRRIKVIAEPLPAAWEEVLQHVPGYDDRDTWVDVGMALKAELGDAGFPLWENWSK
ncbi:MAG: PriCT-2 domain-containing protein, partial [Rubripirellula sp.]